jgi:hypothetical protein
MIIKKTYIIRSNFLNISTRKLNFIVQKLKGADYTNILNFFKILPTKTGTQIWQTVYNGLHLFCNKYNLNKSQIKIAEICVSRGIIRTTKRPGPKGRALDIQKKQSYFIIKYIEI